MILEFILTGFVSINVASAKAFNLESQSDGVRLKTAKSVYSVGEVVEIQLFLFNKLEVPISACVPAWVLTAKGVMGGRIWSWSWQASCRPLRRRFGTGSGAARRD